MEFNNPNVVQQLRPVNPTGTSTATYQLTKASVSPSRIVGRDERGFPIEETVPTVYWRPFLMLDGCINKVPLRTGSVPSMHADAVSYENETMQDLIMAGCIPAWLCPYSTMYASWTHGPFAKPPAGESDCGGSHAEGGCSHLKALAAVRKKAVADAYNADLERFASQNAAEMTRMRDGIIAGVGAAIAAHIVPAAPTTASAAPSVTPSQRAQRLKDGRED
jgi:hypothetical protein